MTLKEIRKTSFLVKQILESNPKARDSDMILYLLVCKNRNKDVLKMRFGYVICNLRKLGLPAFETVRRTRQKVQSKYPRLCGSYTVGAMRMLNEEEYKKYSVE